MKNTKALWVAAYVLALLLPCAIYLQYELPSGISAAMVVSGILGLLAYTLFAVEFLLTSRPKPIDRAFGLDRLYRFHMVAAVAAILLAFAHKLIKDAFYQASINKTLGNLSLLVFAVVAALSAFFLTDRLFFRTAATDRLRRFLKARLRVPHQAKVLLHNLMDLAFAVILVHVLLAYSVKSSLALELVLIAYFAVPALLYLRRKIWKRWFARGNRYAVSAVEKECANIVTIRFRPEQGGKVFPYLPGQFLYVRVKSPGVPGDEHPFTISSSPSRSGEAAITAKALGDFTCALPNVHAGDRAVLDGPFGSFSYLKYPDAKKLCFLAGGIGVTPFLSMLRYIAENEPEREVTLLWGVREPPELVCREELAEFARAMKGLRLVPVVSHDREFDGERGFITAELISKYVPDLSEWEFFLCGPGPMMDLELKNLKNLGVEKKKVHFERFAM